MMFLMKEKSKPIAQQKTRKKYAALGNLKQYQNQVLQDFNEDDEGLE